MSRLEQGNSADAARRHYRDVTDRIATLLNDAEDAAEQIRADARKSATRILREAEERALARVEELTGEPERLRNVADEYSRETRATADDYSERLRRAADEQARQTRAEVQREAEAMRASAEELVARIEEAGRTRHDEIRAETRNLEAGRAHVVDGLGKTLRGLQKVTTQLENLIGSATPAEERAAEEPEAKGGWLGMRRRKSESNGDGGGVYEALKQGIDDRTPPREDERRELYRQAQELGIKGRSRMTKEELMDAIRERG